MSRAVSSTVRSQFTRHNLLMEFIDESFMSSVESR